MRRTRHFTPLAVVALLALSACGGDDTASVGQRPTIANVGELPAEVIGEGAAGPAPVIAPVIGARTDTAPASTADAPTSSDPCAPEASGPDASAVSDGTVPAGSVADCPDVSVAASSPADSGGPLDSGVPSTAADSRGRGSDPRSTWQRFAADADAETFAGGADAEDLIEGNRLLVVGDSVTASLASRYGGEACSELVPAGWAVEVNAETGRFIDFGEKVIDDRLDAGFDAAVVNLGTNYGQNKDMYSEILFDIVDELAPRPTMLFTVTNNIPGQPDVNDAIYEVAAKFDNVTVIDWATESTEDPSLLGGDGIHLSNAGRARMVEMLAERLGDAPEGSDGDCLDSAYTDDSATAPTGTTLPGQAPPPPTTGGNGGDGGDGGTRTTTQPQPVETQPPGPPATTVPGPTDPPPPVTTVAPPPVTTVAPPVPPA